MKLHRKWPITSRVTISTGQGPRVRIRATKAYEHCWFVRHSQPRSRVDALQYFILSSVPPVSMSLTLRAPWDKCSRGSMFAFATKCYRHHPRQCIYRLEQYALIALDTTRTFCLVAFFLFTYTPFRAPICRLAGVEPSTHITATRSPARAV